MNQYQYYQCKKRGCANAVRENTMGTSNGNGCSCRQNGASSCMPSCEGGTGGSCSELQGCALGMVYSPKQHFRDLYCTEEAFAHGTLFKTLFKPILTTGGNGK